MGNGKGFITSREWWIVEWEGREREGEGTEGRYDVNQR